MKQPRPVLRLATLAFGRQEMRWLYSFGPTPMSNGPDPVPASEVNVVGRIVGDARVLKKAKGASLVKIEKAE